jgi:hypothetical protein
MAKNKKYHFDYVDLSNTTHTVEIYVEGFGGVSTEIIGGATPFTVEKNKDFAEQYLGGIAVTKFTVQALSTATFKASLFTSQVYGDVIIRHKTGATYDYDAILVPYNSMDKDLPDGTYITELYCECGLNNLKNIDYVVADQRSKVSAIIHKCLQNVPYIGAYPYKILDNSLLSTDDAGTVTSKWVDVYINENHFADKSCYDVLSELLINIRELTFSNGSWWIRNISELSNLDSFLWSYDASFANPTSAAYNRTAATINDRLSGGYFGKLFSQKNLIVEKSESSSNRQLPEGSFNEIANLDDWDKLGLGAFVFSLTDKGLWNGGNSIYQTVASVDGTYIQNSEPFEYYPFNFSFFLDSNSERDALKVSIKHSDGFGIKNLRLQFIAVQTDLNHIYFLTNEGTWYRQGGNTETPLYFVAPKYGETTEVDIPMPPYYDNREFIFPYTDFGYNQTIFDLIPSTNVKYEFYIRIYLPERLHPVAENVNSYIESIDISVESTEEAFKGFSRNYGVNSLADRQGKFAINIGAGYPVHPHGTETAYTAATGDIFYSYFKEYGGILYKAMDSFIASEYLNVLSRRLKTYDGSVFTQLAFTDLIEIDSVKYRLQNYKLDTRNNTTFIKAIELGYGAATIEEKEVPNVLNQATKDEFRKLIDLQEGRLKTIFPDVNFETKIGNGGETQLVMKPNVQHETALLTGGQVFLRSDTENTVTLDTTEVTNDYTLKAPNLTAEATIATDATAWMLGGNTVGAKKLLGTLDNFDLGIIRNNAEIATVKITGVDIAGRITAATAAITGLTTNYLPKIGAAGLLGNSQIFDSGTNVGIGKATPLAKLDVNGAGRFLGNIDIFTVNGTSDGYIQVTNGTATNSGYMQFRKPGNVRLGYIGFSSLNMNYVAENSAAHTFSGGNVGIKITFPTDDLHVNGTTRTTNLKINNGAAVGKVWQCTNADGSGSWVSPLASERYKGEWDASSGTAPSATPTNGDYYVVSVAGTYLSITYAAGDEIYWDGTAWLRRQNFLTLPTATASILGGVKIGDRISILSGVISADAQDWSIITGKPTTIEGYGITDYDSLWDARYDTEHLGLTTDYLPYWNGTAFVNSQVFDNGTNVGIGKATPLAKLDVNGVGHFLGTVDVFTANGTVDGYIQLTNGNSSNSGYLQFKKPGNVRLGYIGFSSSNMNYVAENSAAHIFLGDVAIGNITPTDPLHVNGTTRTTNLKIDSGAEVGKVWECTNADGTGAWSTLEIANISSLQSTLDAKQNQLNGTGFVKANGTSISYDNNTYEVAFSKSTAFNKNFGTIAGTVAEGNHGHVIGDITSLVTILDGKLNTPTLITNAVPYWDGVEFQNSFLRHGSGELSGQGKIVLKDLGYNTTVLTLDNNSFGGVIIFGGVANAIIPTIDGSPTLNFGYSNQKFKEIDFHVTNHITLDSPIFEEITFQQEGFTRELRGLRIDEFEVSKIGTDIDTGTFSILLGSYDDAGNRRPRDWENIISPSDGRWYKIEADGSAKKYLLEGEVSTGGGGTYEIPTLQEVSEQGASSTIRLQFNNVNYATINDVGEALGLEAVLTNSNEAINRDIDFIVTTSTKKGIAFLNEGRELKGALVSSSSGVMEMTSDAGITISTDSQFIYIAPTQFAASSELSRQILLGNSSHECLTIQGENLDFRSNELLTDNDRYNFKVVTIKGYKVLQLTKI